MNRPSAPNPNQPALKAPDNQQQGGYGGYYYGYGYGSGGYGGGYGGDSGDGNQRYSRTLRDYLLILRERVWYLIVTFFIVFTGSILYTMNSTQLYRSASSVQILRKELTPWVIEKDPNAMVQTMEDFNTQLKILESAQIVNAVADRLKDETLKQFRAPYEDVRTFAGPMPTNQILMENRSVIPVRLSLVLQITYSHPNPNIAAMVANYFADEYINYNLKQNTNDSMKAVEDLRVRVDQQRRRVEDLENQLQDYRSKYNAISFKEKTDIDAQEIMNLSTILTTNKKILDEAEGDWNLVQQYQQEGRDLTELGIISSQPVVQDQLVRTTTHVMNLASMSKRYRPKHPSMIEAQELVDESNRILKENIAVAVQKIYSQYLAGKENYDSAQKRLAEKQRESIELDKIKIGYDSMVREVEIARGLHQALVTSMNGHISRVNLIGNSARIIDKASVAIEPYSPNVPLYLVVGAIGGFVLGMALVFVVAFFDDRIKSAYDIESAVGLPLLGIVPRIRSQNSSEKALAVASNIDRMVTESFRSIYSALKINDISRNAKVLLLTSTLPSEGKSFVTTNMALTSALHGERVLLIDADLRVPNVAKSMGVDTTHGLLTLLEGTDSIETALQKNVYPNLDVLPTGGRAKNPTQLINSSQFRDLLETLRGQYDRIYIDSPPVGAVSDAISMLPMVDGVIYVIKFNNVKRKTAKLNVHRVMDANVPIFGAVLNQISAVSAGYYYNSYYDKSYQSYYLDDEADDTVAADGESSDQSGEDASGKNA